MKILGPAISLGRTAEEKRASRYQWLRVYGEDRGCNSGRYWSAWSNQQHPISVDIENQPLGRTGLRVLVEQIPAGVQARLRLKTTSFVSTLPRGTERMTCPPHFSQHAGHHLEQLPGDMERAPIAARRHIDLAWVAVCDQLGSLRSARKKSRGATARSPRLLADTESARTAECDASSFGRCTT